MLVGLADRLIKRKQVYDFAMKMPRSKLITKIIVFSLAIYAVISLIALRGGIEDVRQERSDVERAIAEQEIANAELEYELDNYDDPDVIANIARSNLGLVLPGEIIFYDSGVTEETAD